VNKGDGSPHVAANTGDAPVSASRTSETELSVYRDSNYLTPIGLSVLLHRTGQYLCGITGLDFELLAQVTLPVTDLDEPPKALTLPDRYSIDLEAAPPKLKAKYSEAR